MIRRPVRRAAAVLYAAVMLWLPGCALGVNVDSLLTPPKLSGEQEQIYQALRSAAGEDIRLKYPTRGDNLSAFTITDIDDDGDEEAVVFYEKDTFGTRDTGLRINILDCVNGEWGSVCDRGALGAQVEKVIISPLGDNGRINIIVGYTGSNPMEKTLAVYVYTGDYLEQTFTHSYTLFDVADTGRGGDHPDLLLVGTAAGTQTAYAAFYTLGEDSRYYEHTYSFQDSYADYTQMLYGPLEDGGVAVYIDAATGTGSLQTEILSLEGDNVVNLLGRCGKKASDTSRRSGLLSRDIDGDGKPEIPVQIPFYGYETAPETEQIWQTRWLSMKEHLLYAKYGSYYSAGDGYVFLLPETWINRVSVQQDAIDSEVRVVVYDGSWQENMTVLARIYIAYDEADLRERLAAGYRLMHTKGTASYLFRVEEGNALSSSLGSLVTHLRFFD